MNALGPHLEVVGARRGLHITAGRGGHASLERVGPHPPRGHLRGHEGETASDGGTLARASVWHMHGHDGGARCIVGHLAVATHHMATSARCGTNASCNELWCLPGGRPRLHRLHRRGTAARPLGGLRCRHGGALTAALLPIGSLLHIPSSTGSPLVGKWLVTPVVLVLVALGHALVDVACCEREAYSLSYPRANV